MMVCAPKECSSDSVQVPLIRLLASSLWHLWRHLFPEVYKNIKCCGTQRKGTERVYEKNSHMFV